MVIDWDMPQRSAWQALPLRVYLRGTGCFSVWSVVDSGEDAPAWAEPELALTFFGRRRNRRASRTEVERVDNGPDGGVGYRVTGGGGARRGDAGTSPGRRGIARRPGDRITRSRWGTLRCRSAWPSCVSKKSTLGAGARSSLARLPYGGQTFGYGEVAELPEPGVSFAHGCIGLALPLLYLHHPAARRGLQCEFMLEWPPDCLAASRHHRRHMPAGASPGRPSACWTPGQTHCYGGSCRACAPYQPARRSRRCGAGATAAATRYGLTSPPAPALGARRQYHRIQHEPGKYRNRHSPGWTIRAAGRCCSAGKRWAYRHLRRLRQPCRAATG